MIESSETRIAAVVPVRGRVDLLIPMLEALFVAVDHSKGVMVVLVDNSPNSETPVAELYGYSSRALIVRSHARTVGAVRNAGVAALQMSVDYLVFLDSDCVVEPDFFDSVIKAFRIPESPTIVGCKVVAPINGHWTELASDELNRMAGDGPRLHMNSGCMAIWASEFDELGGFDETLVANEDYDLCDRVRARGGAIWQLESLRSIHLGNPKSVGGVFRRLRWHGRGTFDSRGRLQLTPMAILVLANTAVVTMTPLLIAIMSVWTGDFRWLVILPFAPIIIPAVFWLARMLQLARWIPPQRAIPFALITLLARQAGMFDQWIAIRDLRRSS